MRFEGGGFDLMDGERWWLRLLGYVSMSGMGFHTGVACGRCDVCSLLYI